MIAPTPIRLDPITFDDRWRDCWVRVDLALPPERQPVIVLRRSKASPLFGYLRYAAGDLLSPFFVTPHANCDPDDFERDITAWLSPDKCGLPGIYVEREPWGWGLTGVGWRLLEANPQQ